MKAPFTEHWHQRLAALDLMPLGEPKTLSGGDIAALWIAQTSQGRIVIKHDNPERLSGEADGLRALRAAGTCLMVPEVLALDDDLLIMEALERAPGGCQAEQSLAQGLRELHAIKGVTHGWERDNACGLTPQSNLPCRDGRVFQRERRLLPLGELCRDQGLLDAATYESLTDIALSLEEWLPDTAPSLVHGDLWSGNVLYTSRGVAIIDPAIYRHYGEVDLAMLMLFGSPSEAFFEAYWNGRRPSDWQRRKALFQLYPLLNHLLLFGGGYRSAVKRAIAELH